MLGRFWPVAADVAAGMAKVFGADVVRAVQMNVTDEAQVRAIVLEQIKGIAVQGTKWVKQYAAPLVAAGTRMRFESLQPS